ncbi:nuclear transport factor 2 family protein [Streptosporangium subroseum]|uniref:nuclear transport factor 2 family protein n=1 Tax=Streptosporangium subroseum TaxID=106412 RepID=UPI00308762FA|nr:nuclear transport factor 2 family protein [Streptosporangium subroseum]
MTSNTIATAGLADPTADPAADLTAARARNEDVWRRSSRLLYAGQIDEFVGHWCEDASYEAALPVPGLPAVITGHEALHAAFSGLVAGARSIAAHDVRFHQTDDPDVAIIEERLVAELADGSGYENRFIIRVTFRDGRIADMLEYYGQFAHQDLLRRLGFGS